MKKIIKKQKEQAIKITKTHYMDLVDKIWKALDGDPIRNREDYWKRLNSDHPHVGKGSIFTLSEMIEKAINQIKWEVEKNKNKIDNFSDMVIVNKELVLSNQELRSINAKLIKENEEIKKDIEAKIASHIKNLIMKEFNPIIEAEEQFITTVEQKLRKMYGIEDIIKEILYKRLNNKSQYKEIILLKGKDWNYNFTDKTSIWDTLEAKLIWDATGLLENLLKIATLDEVDIYIHDYPASKNCLKKDIPELKI